MTRFVRRKRQGLLHRFYFLLWEGPDWTGDYWCILANPCLWLLCFILGHQPIDDQCNKPEHRYCVWCRALQANKDTIE